MGSTTPRAARISRPSAKQSCKRCASFTKRRTTPLFFFTDTAPPEIYTLSLHDALPIWPRSNLARLGSSRSRIEYRPLERSDPGGDRKSTRLNSSHRTNSYAGVCLKKKKFTIPSASRDKKEIFGHPATCRLEWL